MWRSLGTFVLAAILYLNVLKPQLHRRIWHVLLNQYQQKYIEEKHIWTDGDKSTTYRNSNFINLSTKDTDVRSISHIVWSPEYKQITAEHQRCRCAVGQQKNNSGKQSVCMVREKSESPVLESSKVPFLSAASHHFQVPLNTMLQPPLGHCLPAALITMK